MAVTLAGKKGTTQSIDEECLAKEESSSNIVFVEVNVSPMHVPNNISNRYSNVYFVV